MGHEVRVAPEGPLGRRLGFDPNTERPPFCSERDGAVLLNLHGVHHVRG